MSISLFIDEDGYEYYQIDEQYILENAFTSSVKEFTDYYHRDSIQDMSNWLARMYVIERNSQVLGYVTLAMARLRSDATKKIKKIGVNENIPALLISHLAVHKDFQRCKIGTKLLDLVFELVPKLQKWAGCRYVLLSPRNDSSVMAFYDNYGFEHPPNFKDDKYSDVYLMDLKSYYSI